MKTISKKILTSLLSASMALSLAACGGSSTSAPASSAAPKAEASSAAASESAAAPTEVLTLRLSSNHADDFPTSIACQKFADLVKERTNGRVNIECYFNAVLGDEKSVIEQAQFGSIDFVRVSISPMAEFVDDFNALQMPYIYRDSDHYWRVLNGDIGMSLLKCDEIKDKGLYGLCYYDGGARSFYNSKKEVHTPADMAGLNIRVQESSLMMGMVSAMGANPTPMAYGEVYSALQTGVVDGAENSVPQYLAVSHYEVAPYLSLDEHTRAADMLVMSTKTMEKLTPEEVKIVEDAALESCDYQRELWKASEAEALEKVKAANCTVTELTAEEKTAFQEAVAKLNAEEGAKYKDLLDAIAAA